MFKLCRYSVLKLELRNSNLGVYSESSIFVILNPDNFWEKKIDAMFVETNLMYFLN